MEVYKILPSTLNPIMVRNTLAVYGGLNVETRSVGDLVALAEVGGTTVPGRTPTVKSAFAISEVGETSGIMIDGAKPYFNIFSTNAPGYWYKSGSVIKYRLKNSGPDQSKLYAFSLGDFRGYDHTAIPLSWSIGASWYQAENKVRFNGMVVSGDYDWSLVMSEQYGIIPAVNIYDATGLTKLGTFYADEPYSVNVNEYYFFGELDASQALSYVCRVGFVTLRADGTPGATAYVFQKSGWFNPEGISQAATIKPTDVATTATFGIDIPYEVTITEDSVNVTVDSNNPQYTRYTASFKCLDYTNVPIGSRSRSISVTVNNPITHNVLYNNDNFGLHTLKATNTISITIPVFYTEMNTQYSVALI